VAEQVASTMGVPFLGAIPLDPQVAVDSDSGKPFVIENPDSPASRAFRDIVSQIEKVIEL